MMNLLGRYI